MADFDARPTFRVKDTGQLLVCKCDCSACAAATNAAGHCSDCSIGRGLARIRRKNTREAAALSAQMQEQLNAGGQVSAT
jgi:hypothetical protein